MCVRQVYNKLVVTSLKYTPMILAHHVPYKTLSNGKLYVLFSGFQICGLLLPSTQFSRYSKPPTATPKLQTLQKLIQSYFLNILHILDQLTDAEMIKLAVEESAKIIPWVLGSRRGIKLYLKVGSSLLQEAAFADADIS